MKKILFSYLVTIFGCFIMGVVMALLVCVSRWHLFGFLIPLLLVCPSVNYLFDNAYNYLLGTTLLALFGFLSFTVFLILGALYVNEETFLGIMYIVSVTMSLFLTLGILLRLHTKWQLKNFEENQYRT